jgi:branched-chain amino acid transport system substrate-binding protein
MKTIILLLLAFIAACSTSEIRKDPAEQATAGQLKEYRFADELYKKKNISAAVKKFSEIVQKYPRSDLANESLQVLGQIYYDQGDYFRAGRYWQAIVDSPVASRHYDRAALGAATAHAQMGRFDDALNVLAKFKVGEGTDRNLAAQAYELSSKLKLQKSAPLAALEDIMIARSFRTTPQEKQTLMARAIEIINGNLNPQQLEEAASNAKFEELELPLRYRTAVSMFEQKSWGSAKRLFLGLAEKYPTTEQGKRAQQYVAAIDAQEKTDSTVVGAILPLSGKYSQQGYKTLRGIQLGLGLFNRGGTPLKLAIIDSEGNPDVARRGVERLVSEDHVVAIIGDILSKTAQAVAIKSQELGVPCLTLSQKQGLTDIGDFVFRNTLTPDMQIRTLVDVAMKQRGYRRFAILFPNDQYGTEYASTFWDYVLLNGGQIMAAQSYQSDETDFRAAIQRMVGTFYSEEDRGKELALRIAAWEKDQKTKTARDKLPKDILPPIVDFDAIFIPDSPKAVGQIAAMLAYNDVNQIPLIGTNLWNTPQIVARGSKFVENSLFVDDYFGDDQSPAMKRFVSDFQTQFQYKPDVFEAQGFDSALLMAKVLQSYDYNINRVGLRDRLAVVSNVQGATGPIRMSLQKEVEKLLIPLTVLNGQVVKLDTSGGAAQ